MKTKLVLLLSGLLLSGALGHAASLGTAFTYQGSLKDAGQPANGTIPMVFRLWDDPMAGINVGSPSFVSANVPVANGLFSIDLDFGVAAFSGDARWLEIRVNGTLLTTRQRVAPTPHALYASTAGTVKNGAILTLPYSGTASSPNPLFQVNNSGNGASSDGIVGTTASSASQISGVRGIATSPSGVVVGVYGVATDSPSGTGVVGYGGAAGGYFTSTQFGGRAGVFDGSVTISGFVGIGTTTPETKLTVRTVLGSSNPYGIEHSSGTVRLSTLIDGASASFGTRSDHPLRFFVNDGPASMTIATAGNVGIGTIAPQAKLEVVGQNALRLIGFQPFLTLLDANAGNAPAKIQTADGNFHFTPSGGHATFWATDLWLGHPARRGAPGRALVDGGGALHLNFASDWANTVIGGANVSVATLTIRGGADLAEPFQMSSENIPKGAVVVIDSKNPGRLKMSDSSYDKRVAGIVSGANGINPGIALHQEGVLEGGENVALTGRVYVQADTTQGAIEPGDLLTTSDTPGHAMKVADHAQAQGAILGKAMSRLKEGKGMVLVLVTLQ